MKQARLQLKFVDWNTISCNKNSCWKKYTQEGYQTNEFHTDIDEGLVNLTIHYSFVEEKLGKGFMYVHILMVYEDNGHELKYVERRVKEPKKEGIEYIAHLMNATMLSMQEELETRLGFEI